MSSTMTELHRATKRVMRPVLAGQTVKVTDQGKPAAKITPDYPVMTMTAEAFRALPISDEELNHAINEALAEIRA
jgi:antitoxin (DNA-binding transcriptional repressor) of toxin-antitoxin stability system